MMSEELSKTKTNTKVQIDTLLELLSILHKTVRLIMFFHICFSFFGRMKTGNQVYYRLHYMRFTDRVIIFVVVHFFTFI